MEQLFLDEGFELKNTIMTILYLKFSGAKTYHEQPQVDSQKASIKCFQSLLPSGRFVLFPVTSFHLIPQ